MGKKTSQNDLIFARLNAGGKISALSALRDFGCMRLASRIHELRQRGHKITSEDREQNGKKYAVYRLEKPDNGFNFG